MGPEDDNEGSGGGAPVVATDLMPAAYEFARATPGVEYYVDRSFVFTSVPPAFHNWLLIRTANEDKSVTAASAISFTLSAMTTVAIAYDRRATSLPGWLADWEDASAGLSTSDGPSSPLPIRTKRLGPGQVNLGGNLSDGAVGAGSMYVILIEDGDESAIRDRHVADVRVSPSSVTLDEGTAAALRATAYDQSGNPFSALPTGKSWSWSSSRTEVASVDGSGLVSALSVGSARIDATVDGVTGSGTVTVRSRSSSGSDPELPRTFIDTQYRQPSGGTIQVNAGGNLQNALNDAQPGDQIVLQAGASFEGSFTLPAKSGSEWIVIRSSASDAQLPPAGTRIDPSYAGVLPKIVATGDAPALRTAAGAHHYRIIGVEFTVRSSVTLNYGIVNLGNGGGTQNSLDLVPHDIILDRVYVHGHSNLNVSRCVGLNSAMTAVIDSYLSECHARGFDSQAIGGWNGPGPFKIVNNFLAGSGENIIFGGADPSISNLTPSDIEIRRNHFYKPPSWRGVWTVKNLFELKNAQRLLIEGNVFENTWPDAQTGWAIIWKSENQSGGAPWSVTQDVTFRYNIIRNVSSGLDISASGSGYHNDTPTSRVKIHDNLFDRLGSNSDFGGGGRLFMLLNDHRDVKIIHNTGFGVHSIIVAEGPAASGFRFLDNIVWKGGYGIFGTGTGEGIPTLEHYMPGYIVQGNVLIRANASNYPAGNYFPADMDSVGFVNWPDGDYRLGANSPYKDAATDGLDPGADIEAVLAATSGVVH
jgi:hypothetical protein